MRVPLSSAALLVVCAVMELSMGQVVVPDFVLSDTNPNSVRFGEPVSPRDYRLQISGYYFGDAG